MAIYASDGQTDAVAYFNLLARHTNRTICIKRGMLMQ